MKIFLISLGWLSFLLGFIGVFVPLLPTTPFMIFAAYCFSKSSPKFYGFVISRPLIGPAVKEWQEKGLIRIRAKIWATTLLAISFAVLYLKSDNFIVIVGFVLVASVVLAFIWSRPHELSNDKKIDLINKIEEQK